MIINCDIGERGARHPVDLELMNHIGMANIACGGHAGDAQSIEAFTRMALEKSVLVSAHLSYPDREHFGRLSLPLSTQGLLASLDAQLDASIEKERVKLHGALYNDCNTRADLALTLAGWLHGRGVKQVLAPFDSHLARLCLLKGVDVCFEAFAERRYEFDEASGQLRLMSRTSPRASIHSLEEAIGQCLDIAHRAKVKAVLAGSPEDAPKTVEKELSARTLCIHSDSDIALPLAIRLGELLRTEP